MIVSNINNMNTATERLQQFFDNLLAFCEPVFKALGEKVVVIEIVRHPLYMFIQQTLNMEHWCNSTGASRQFHLFIQYGKQQLPFWNFDLTPKLR